MKANELRNKTDQELSDELGGLLREQFNLRMQKATEQLSKNSELQRVRRSIARVKTIMAQKAKAGSGQ